MSIYKVLAVTKIGTSKDGQKNYKRCTIETPEGTELADVTFWDWKMKDMWDRVTPNMSVEGTVEIDPKWGAGFEPHFNTYSKAPRQGKGQAVAAAMERKEQAIATAQGNKEQGIRISSTIGNACLVVAALIENSKREWSDKEVSAEILKYRHFLWRNWENVSNYPDEADVTLDF